MFFFFPFNKKVSTRSVLISTGISQSLFLLGQVFVGSGGHRATLGAVLSIVMHQRVLQDEVAPGRGLQAVLVHGEGEEADPGQGQREEGREAQQEGPLGEGRQDDVWRERGGHQGRDVPLQ